MDLSFLWLFLPLIPAAALHAPVLRWDLFAPLKRPLDGGARFRGRRIFGDNKTWRGALVLFAGALAATLLLSRVDAWWQRLPSEIQRAGALGFGALLRLGVVLGELPNSFLKRQLDIAPGAQRRSPLGVAVSLFDQADFVPVVYLLLLPIWTMAAWQALVAFAAVAAVHMVINLIGFAIGARKNWL